MSDKIERGVSINVKDIKKEDHEYMKKSSIPISTFIREAISEKIERDKK